MPGGVAWGFFFCRDSRPYLHRFSRDFARGSLCSHNCTGLEVTWSWTPTPILH
uniref:Uncharacterized protein n=1 Tax=Anguilla anguilla TaxID=7936 RepID=A0A0E9X154_ANGAN